MARIGLVHEYGPLENGEINQQTLARCRKALALYRMYRIEKVFIAVGTVEKGVLAAEQMKQYFIQNGVSEGDVIIDPRGHNTAGEIDVCLGHLKYGDEVVSVSSWYHCPRIKFLWYARGRKVKVVAAWRGIPLSNLIVDIPNEIRSLKSSFFNPLGRSKVHRAGDVL